jgi:hypothetical protein
MRFKVGNLVKTSDAPKGDQSWTEEAIKMRQFGVKGLVRQEHDSHGLCYTIEHSDKTKGCYNPEELELCGDANPGM